MLRFLSFALAKRKKKEETGVGRGRKRVRERAFPVPTPTIDSVEFSAKKLYGGNLAIILVDGDGDAWYPTLNLTLTLPTFDSTYFRRSISNT